jgi:ABC-type sugar transport system ATPase subunit
MQMEVMLVEPLGSTSLVTLQRDGWQLTAHRDGRHGITEKQKVEVSVDVQQTHLFDRSTGLTLSQGAPAG